LSAPAISTVANTMLRIDLTIWLARARSTTRVVRPKTGAGRARCARRRQPGRNGRAAEREMMKREEIGNTMGETGNTMGACDAFATIRSPAAKPTKAGRVPAFGIGDKQFPSED
jgi:hypothetical protein